MNIANLLNNDEFEQFQNLQRKDPNIIFALSSDIQKSINYIYTLFCYHKKSVIATQLDFSLSETTTLSAIIYFINIILDIMPMAYIRNGSNKSIAVELTRKFIQLISLDTNIGPAPICDNITAELA